MVTVQTLRKYLALSGTFLGAISDGYIVGQMTGMVAAQQSKDSDLPLNDNEMSWIVSTIHATCICGFALAALVSEKFGRRKALTIMTTPIIINWIALYYAQEMIVFMVSRIIVGVCFGGVLSLCILSTAEYTAPNVRAFYLYGINVGTTLGGSIAHILSVLFHWRTVAIIGIIPSFLSALVPIFCVESPTWLASKGRFDECKAAFEALHGVDKNKAELQLLIDLEVYKQKKISDDKTSKIYIVRYLLRAIRKKYFWKIATLCVFLHLYRVSVGKALISTFILTIIHDVIGDSDMLLVTIVTDACFLIGSFLSCYLITKMKIRPLLFSFGLVAAGLLILFSASLYFVPEKDSFMWIKISLLALYMIVSNAGPSPVLESLFGEIYPLELKTYCMFGFGAIGGVILFLSIKLALPMFNSIGYHGVFLFHAMLALACHIYFWLYMPETKGRTLQEIELFFKNGKFLNINTLLDEEHRNRLI